MSLERGRFQNLFEIEDAEIMILVDKLFDYFFSEKFVEEGQTFISGVEYREAIEAKIVGDPMADILSEKFSEEEPAVSRQQIRDALA